MTFRAKRRDAVERLIIDALQAVGASVQQLDGKGLPDLLVGYQGTTYLLEAKDAHGKHKRGGKRSTSGLRDTQDAWWSTWQGAAPVVVTNADEALVAIGALRPLTLVGYQLRNPQSEAEFRDVLAAGAEAIGRTGRR